jgi:hypothetical protein
MSHIAVPTARHRRDAPTRNCAKKAASAARKSAAASEIGRRGGAHDKAFERKTIQQIRLDRFEIAARPTGTQA